MTANYTQQKKMKNTTKIEIGINKNSEINKKHTKNN